MIVLSLLLLAVGMCMSAFCSGSETSFYRASRTRLILDAREGSRQSRRLLFFANHPSLFVASALVGNNCANYVISLAVVLFVGAVAGSHAAAEILANVFFTPIIFIYGELLPKNVAFQVPNRILRFSGPIYAVMVVLFAPITLILWGFGLLLERIFGQSPTRVRMALARDELRDVLLEGKEAGLLHASQLEISRNFIDVSTFPATYWMESLRRVVPLDSRQPRDEALARIRALKVAALPVREASRGRLIGYVSAVELAINRDVSSLRSLVKPMIDVPPGMVCAEALLLLRARQCEMAVVIGENGREMGIVRQDSLIKPLLGARLKSAAGAHL